MNNDSNKENGTCSEDSCCGGTKTQEAEKKCCSGSTCLCSWIINKIKKIFGAGDCCK